MGSVRQDYLLKQFELLRQAVKRAVTKRPDPELDEALLLALHLQEKLFPLPPAAFLSLDLAGQIAALRQGESREAGNEKCRMLARLLVQTSLLYQHKGLADLTAGARQMALYAALSVVVDDPADLETAGLARELLAVLDPTTLHPPVSELLQRAAVG
jgi:hypothetical protein